MYKFAFFIILYSFILCYFLGSREGLDAVMEDISERLATKHKSRLRGNDSLYIQPKRFFFKKKTRYRNRTCFSVANVYRGLKTSKTNNTFKLTKKKEEKNSCLVTERFVNLDISSAFLHHCRQFFCT